MNVSTWGSLPDGRSVRLFTLTNPGGLSLSVMEYGAAVTDCLVPDRDGGARHIVLGYGSLEDYLAGNMFMGATVGRIAGRLSGAWFEIDGVRYEVAANDGSNHLHGGDGAFHTRLWAGQAVQHPAGEAVRMRYTSPAGEEGYPGRLEVAVTFVVERDANTVRIEYEATTDAPTPFSPTNHSYYNLGGDEVATVEEHLLRIDADAYTPNDDAMGHLGVIRSVEGSGADLRRERSIAEIMPGLHKQHGDNYLLRAPGLPGGEAGAVEAAGARTGGDAAAPRSVAVAWSPESGIEMTVATNAACLQFFGGRYIPPKPPGRSGRDYGPYAGFCLECQDYPDGPSHPEICDITLRPGATYRQRSDWRFGLR